MKVWTIKLSGRVFDNFELVKRYVSIFRTLLTAVPDLKLVIVTGGGEIARKYVSIIRELARNESLADIAGILVSRLNAQVLISGLEEAYPKPPETVSEFLQAFSTYRVVVCGGLQPGQSTATVALLLAEVSRSRDVVFCSNVDAVYTDDPRKNPNARKLEKITLSELEEILRRTSDIRAGTYQLIDQWAINIARRAGIRIYITDCRRPELVQEIVLRGTGYGTLVVPD